MSEIWYQISIGNIKWETVNIREIVIMRSTRHFLIYENGSREAKINGLNRYFQTKVEAKNYIIKTLKVKINNRKKDIKDMSIQLENLKLSIK